MIKSILHFFKIHRKMVLGNPTIVVKNMFGITPKSLNAVNVILAFVGKSLAMVQSVMFPPAPERVVTPKGISVVHGSFSGMLLDMCHQFISGHPLNNLSVDPAIALKKPKNNAFSGRTPATLSFASATEVGLINLNLSLQFPRFQFRYMIDGLAQALINARDHLIVQSKIACHTIRRLLLVEAGKDGYLLSQSFQRLLFSATLPTALYIPTFGPHDPKRTTKNTLSASQKVGRTVKNILLSCNHKGIVSPHGYESH